MTDEGVSRSALLSAAFRAIGAKNPDAKFRNPDHLAAVLLGKSERLILQDGSRSVAEALEMDFETAMLMLPAADVVTGMCVRTRYCDETVHTYCATGTEQVVVLGAGLDSRGYRLLSSSAGIRVFEVDNAPTQKQKISRVHEVFKTVPEHVRYVPVDFTTDDLLAALLWSGYSEALRTLFIWEGVTMYLPERAIMKVLEFVREHASTGSGVVFDYYLSTYPTINDPTTVVARWGEPVLFGFPGGSASELVGKSGLRVVYDHTREQMEEVYAKRSDGTRGLPGTTRGAAERSGMCHAIVL